MPPESTDEIAWDVVIAGAGPVGMALAALLSAWQCRVLILEKRPSRVAMSRAIGITPPSLAILAELGLSHRCLGSGLPIRDAVVHGDRGPVCDLGFHDLPGDHPFILSLPQSDLEEILEAQVQNLPGVELRRCVAVTGLEDLGDRVRVRHNARDRPQEVARWLVACDGAGSEVRAWAGLDCRQAFYPCRFAMADFIDRSDLEEVAHLYFSRQGTVESFPLPGGRRRWIAQILDSANPEAETGSTRHLGAIRCRTGWAPEEGDLVSEWSVFQPRWLLGERFHRGRTILCGDAAHVMSPIGGQGMNTGLAAAHDLSCRLGRILNRGADAERELADHERARRRAFLHSGRFAALCMWIGTRRGPLSAPLRDWLIERSLRWRPVRDYLARRFAMVDGWPGTIEQGRIGNQTLSHWTSRQPEIGNRGEGMIKNSRVGIDEGDAMRH